MPKGWRSCRPPDFSSGCIGTLRDTYGLCRGGALVVGDFADSVLYEVLDRQELLSR